MDNKDDLFPGENLYLLNKFGKRKKHKVDENKQQKIKRRIDTSEITDTDRVVYMKIVDYIMNLDIKTNAKEVLYVMFRNTPKSDKWGHVKLSKNLHRTKNYTIKYKDILERHGLIDMDNEIKLYPIYNIIYKKYQTLQNIYPDMDEFIFKINEINKSNIEILNLIN